MKKKFRNFKDARKFVHTLKLKNVSDWLKYCKSNKKPDNVPKSPDSFYKRRKQWNGWGDFLGTYRVANQSKKSIYLTYDQAIKWVHKQNIKNKNDWKNLINSPSFPNNIPKEPRTFYKKQGSWRGSGHWYGTGKKSTHDVIWRSFKEARKYVHDQEFQNKDEYSKWAKTNQKPQNIPAAPKRIYKEYIDWEDWLGNKIRKQRQFLSYSEVKKWVQKKKIISGTMWNDLVKQNKIPKNIPKAPEKFYKEWNGWSKFLENTIHYMDYSDARKFIKSKKIVGDSSFRNYKKNNSLPNNFPRAPDSFYKKQGTWISWGNFCGTGVVATQKRTYLSFTNARDFVHEINIKNRSEWNVYCKSGKKPKNIPIAPDSFYKRKKQWTNWGDFLGTGVVATQIISQNWLPWPQAKLLYRKIGKENNLKNLADWNRYIKKHKLPKGLPSYPADIYTKERVWRSMKK